MNSPVQSDAQMLTLTEALQTAKREIETQSVRLRDLEAMLTEERRAREDAEEKAKRLELEREQGSVDVPLTNGDIHKPESSDDSSDAETVVANGTIASSLPEVATARLQQRLDTMVFEMNEMKVQMEKYRLRAESAEADRKSLAEMIESIRHDNAKLASKEAKRRSRSGSESANGSIDEKNDGSLNESGVEEGEITIINERDISDTTADATVRQAAQNGRVDAKSGDSNKTSQALTAPAGRNHALLHGAPTVSMLTVVALGVAVMAFLNNYPKVDR